MQLPSRDSVLWSWGTMAGIVLTLASLTPTGAAEVGIPADWLPYIRLAALILGTGSAAARSSPLTSTKEREILRKTDEWSLKP